MIRLRIRPVGSDESVSLGSETHITAICTCGTDIAISNVKVARTKQLQSSKMTKVR